MTVTELRRDLTEWKGRAAFRRRKLKFYRTMSRRPAAEKKKLIANWLGEVREAEAKVAHLSAALTAAEGKDDALEVYGAASHIGAQGRPYVFGGGHGVSASRITPKQGLDCSSSSWLALLRADVTQTAMAPHSSQFGRMNGMLPGPGKYVTVWYNNTHVWIRFSGLGRYWRFDTSPWGWGGHGPRMRLTPRPTRGFNACHPAGC